jgi:hypothetical protein
VSNKTNVARLKLTGPAAEKRIREIAQSSAHVILSTHALVRMLERGFLDIDVFRILRSGSIDGVPVLTDRGEWKCKMTQQIKGGRTGGVVTIILQGGKLLVKTVEWEDGR